MSRVSQHFPSKLLPGFLNYQKEILEFLSILKSNLSVVCFSSRIVTKKGAYNEYIRVDGRLYVLSQYFFVCIFGFLYERRF